MMKSVDATQESLWLSREATPIGVALLVSDGPGALVALDWVGCEDRMLRLLARWHPAGARRPSERQTPGRVRRALRDYFAGDLSALTSVPRHDPGTSFQRKVYSALCKIAPGQTRSYGDLAQQIGQPTAARAVGLANGSNPIGLVVPCHRVIGADGSLTGYAGGMARKRWLLTHEGAIGP